MRVEDALVRYPEMAHHVFDKKRSVFTRAKKFTTTKYDSSKLEDAVKDIINTRVPQDPSTQPRQKGFSFLQFKSPEDLCRT